MIFDGDRNRTESRKKIVRDYGTNLGEFNSCPPNTVVTPAVPVRSFSEGGEPVPAPVGTSTVPPGITEAKAARKGGFCVEQFKIIRPSLTLRDYGVYQSEVRALLLHSMQAVVEE